MCIFFPTLFIIHRSIVWCDMFYAKLHIMLLSFDCLCLQFASSISHYKWVFLHLGPSVLHVHMQSFLFEAIFINLSQHVYQYFSRTRKFVTRPRRRKTPQTCAFINSARAVRPGPARPRLRHANKNNTHFLTAASRHTHTHSVTQTVWRVSSRRPFFGCLLRLTQPLYTSN